MNYYKQILLQILAYLQILERDSKDEYRLYISSEFDSNQTHFEEQSNECLIATKARDDVVGHVLSFFLRMIVDENYELGKYCCNEDGEEIDYRDLTIDELVDHYQEKEFDNVDKFEMDKPIIRGLYIDHEETEIRRNIEEIDIYDLDRISQIITELEM